MDHTITWRIRFAHVILAMSMLVMGACGIIYEYTLGVMGNNLMGSSREQIFVVIGLMMFSMGLGAALQQRLVNNLIDHFLLIELLLGLVGGVSTLAIFASFAWTDSYRLVMYSFVLTIGALIGCEIPLLIRINSKYMISLRHNLSVILCMDYVGSLIGALLFAYVLLARMSLERISLILGCVNTLLAMGGLLFFWPMVRRRHVLAAGCCCSLMILGTTAFKADVWTIRLEQRCFEDPVVHSETTTYQHLVLTHSRPRNRLRLYIDGHLQFSSKDEAIYHELLVHVPMAAAASHQRVLILGGGDGLALREVLRFGDVRSVTLVDIDPAMIRLSSEHPEMILLNRAAFHDARVHARVGKGIGPGETTVIKCRTKRHPLIDRTEYKLAEVRVFTVDADLFVSDVTDKYDVVIIDFPDPRTVELAKLYSVEFYRALAQRLAPGATVAIQSTDPNRAARAFSCIGRTHEAAGFRRLPYHDHVPSFGEWGWYLAWRGGETEAQMRNRLWNLESLSVETTYVTPDVINAAFVFGKRSPALYGAVRANTKMRPVIMHYYSLGFE